MHTDFLDTSDSREVVRNHSLHAVASPLSTTRSHVSHPPGHQSHLEFFHPAFCVHHQKKRTSLEVFFAFSAFLPGFFTEPPIPNSPQFFFSWLSPAMRPSPQQQKKSFRISSPTCATVLFDFLSFAYRAVVWGMFFTLFLKLRLQPFCNKKISPASPSLPLGVRQQQ